MWWPGGPDGFPFRGKTPPLTTKTEYDDLRLPGTFHYRLVFLADPKDAEDYRKICDRCVNGLYLKKWEDRAWDEQTRNYRVGLEWVEVAYDTAQLGGTDAVHEETKSAPTIQPLHKLAGLNKVW